MLNPQRLAALVAMVLLFLLPDTAQAYIGPGTGLGAIIVAVALIFGVLLLVVGVVWYPLKRFIKGKKSSPSTGGGPERSE